MRIIDNDFAYEFGNALTYVYVTHFTYDNILTNVHKAIITTELFIARSFKKPVFHNESCVTSVFFD